MQFHHDNVADIAAPMSAVFGFLDDPQHLTAHMGKGSWMMGGGGMTTAVDEGRGQAPGSHIRLSGTAFGLSVYLDEVIEKREPGRSKRWRTVGPNRLLVIGDYAMGFELTPRGEHTQARVYIDYDLPRQQAWLGKLLGSYYARLCVDKMLRDAQAHFGRDMQGERAIRHRAA